MQRAKWPFYLALAVFVSFWALAAAGPILEYAGAAPALRRAAGQALGYGFVAVILGGIIRFALLSSERRKEYEERRRRIRVPQRTIITGAAVMMGITVLVVPVVTFMVNDVRTAALINGLAPLAMIAVLFPWFYAQARKASAEADRDKRDGEGTRS